MTIQKGLFLLVLLVRSGVTKQGHSHRYTVGSVYTISLSASLTHVYETKHEVTVKLEWLRDEHKFQQVVS